MGKWGEQDHDWDLEQFRDHVIPAEKGCEISGLVELVDADESQRGHTGI